MDLSDHKTATYCEIMQQPDVWLRRMIWFAEMKPRYKLSFRTTISERIPKLSWRVLERRPLSEMHWPGFLWKKAILNVEP